MTSCLEGALCHTPGGVGLTLMAVPLLEEHKRRSGEPRLPCCFSGLWAKPSCSAAVRGPGATPSAARGSYLESSPWGFLLISVVDLPQRCVQFEGIVFFGVCVLILRNVWKLCWLPPGPKKNPTITEYVVNDENPIHEMRSVSLYTNRLVFSLGSINSTRLLIKNSRLSPHLSPGPNPVSQSNYCYFLLFRSV